MLSIIFQERTWNSAKDSKSVLQGFVVIIHDIVNDSRDRPNFFAYPRGEIEIDPCVGAFEERFGALLIAKPKVAWG